MEINEIGSAGAMNPLVTVNWLGAHLNDADVVVLDASLPLVGQVPVRDVRARYGAGRIPGAVFFDIEEFSDHASKLPHMLPSADEFSRRISALGVGDQMTIVVYEQEGVFSAPRAWWMLRTFGARSVYLLDGGLKAWVDAGLPVESGPVESGLVESGPVEAGPVEAGPVRRPAANFVARYEERAVKDYADVQAMLGESGEVHMGQILDARSAGRFLGSASEPRPGLSSGHMPGAVNVPFTELLEDGRLRSAEELRVYFQSKGVRLDRPITTSCGSGVTAAVIALGLEMAGARDISLYDGSWAEYAQQPDAVIELGDRAG